MKRLVLLVLMLTSVLAACASQQLAGQRIKKTYEVDAFDSIAANGYNLVISGDKTSSVVLVGSQQAIANTVVAVNDKVLAIHPEHRRNVPGSQSVTAYISMPLLKKLTFQGDGDIKARNLKGQRSIIKTSSGSGLLSIQGNKLDLQTLNSSRRGDVLISGLNTQHLAVRLNSHGNVQLTGNMGLDKLQAAGSGQVKLSGVASRSANISVGGARKVRLLGDVGLSELIQTSSGEIDIPNATGKGITIDSSGNGKVRLAGKLAATKLVSTGNSVVALSGLDTKSLDMQLDGQTSVYLMGQVTQLNATLSGMSRLFAHDLLATVATVRAQQQAEAKLLVQDRLHALALGNSYIGYWGNPKLVGDYMGQTGSVLRLTS